MFLFSSTGHLVAKPDQGEVTQVVQAPKNTLSAAVATAPSTNQVKITLPFQQQNAPLVCAFLSFKKKLLK